MKIKKKHGKTQEEAKERMISLAETMGLTLEWVDTYSAVGSLNYNGVTVTGAATVDPVYIQLDVDIPRLARIFEKRIQKQVEAQMGDALK